MENPTSHFSLNQKEEATSIAFFVKHYERPHPRHAIAVWGQSPTVVGLVAECFFFRTDTRQCRDL